MGIISRWMLVFMLTIIWLTIVDVTTVHPITGVCFIVAGAVFALLGLQYKEEV